MKDQRGLTGRQHLGGRFRPLNRGIARPAQRLGRQGRMTGRAGELIANGARGRMVTRVGSVAILEAVDRFVCGIRMGVANVLVIEGVVKKQGQPGGRAGIARQAREQQQSLQ